jgi:hypothetical protein
MPSRDEIVQSLTGAWRLFLDRSDALRYFDFSVDGFWRSFGAIVLILPAYVVISIAERAQILNDALPDDGFSLGVFIANKVLALAFDWISFPILLALAARQLDIGRTYAAFIIVRNWGGVLAIVPFALVALLFLLGLIGGAAARFFSLAILVIVVRFNYLIARRALGADVPLAVGMLVADFAVSIAIIGVIDSFLAYRPVGS